MGYENSKIYKLQHEDGHFYIGSTYAELRERLRGHKKNARQTPNRRVFQHINNEWDKVRIILIENYPCENKYELLKREDEYIQKELENPLCLNHCRALIGDEEKKVLQKEYYTEYYETNKEHIKQRAKNYRDSHKEEINDKQKEYRKTIDREKKREQQQKYLENNRERINARRRELRALKKSLLK